MAVLKAGPRPGRFAGAGCAWPEADPDFWAQVYGLEFRGLRFKGLYRNYIGIMEKKMETTNYVGFRV